MKFFKLTFSALFFAGFCLAVSGQDGTRTVITTRVPSPESFAWISSAKPSDRLKEAWSRLVKVQTHEEFLCRAIFVREVAGGTPDFRWSKDIKDDQKNYIVFCCADFPEQRFRWDVIRFENQALKRLGLAKLKAEVFGAKSLGNAIRIARSYGNRATTWIQTPEFVVVAKSSDQTINVGLPKQVKGSWPSGFDPRLLGWCSIEQLVFPTSFEQWINIIQSTSSFHHMVDDSSVIAWMDTKRQMAYRFLFDDVRNAKLKRLEIRVALKSSKTNRLFVCDVPLFQTKFSDEKVNLSKVQVAETFTKSRCLKTYKNELPIDPVVSGDVFDPSWMKLPSQRVKETSGLRQFRNLMESIE